MRLRQVFTLILLFAVVQNILSFDVKPFPARSVFVVNGVIIKPLSISGGIQHYDLPDDWTFGLLRAPSYRDKYIPFHKQSVSGEEYKLERIHTHLLFDSCIKTGSQPKSVRFSLDGKYYVTALLNGEGIEVFYSGSNKKYAKVSLPGKYEERKGSLKHSLFHRYMNFGSVR